MDVAYESDQPCVLASGGQDGTALLWDASTASIKKVIAGHATGILSIKIMGNQLCTGSMDSFCRVVDVEVCVCAILARSA
jgi:WD40 repeat protein